MSDTNSTPLPKRLLPVVGVVALVAVALALFLRPGAEPGDRVGDDVGASAGEGPVYLAAPFTTTDGGSAALADYRGEPLVVNFFAAWCGPCRREMPEFEEVFQANDVAFVGISHDLDESSWRSFVDESGVTFATGFQPNQEIYNDIGGIGMPTTILLDGDGEILDLHTGPLSADQLQDKLDEYFQS